MQSGNPVRGVMGGLQDDESVQKDVKWLCDPEATFHQAEYCSL